MRDLEFSIELDRICSFIKDYVHSTGFDNVVVGLSGGIDSSLSAVLAVQALGKEHVYGVMLPYKTSSSSSYEDAFLLANELGIQHERIEITAMVDAYFQSYQQDATNLRQGNWMARTRMCVLYDLSAKYQALVMGTSNRTELLIGYFTQFGDGACAFEPIGHLYKTEVWKIAELLHLPARIIRKTPTADLWTDQTDEGEIGLKYAELDEIIYLLTEKQLSHNDIVQKGIPETKIDKVIKMIENSEFKRNQPPLITNWTRQI